MDRIPTRREKWRRIFAAIFYRIWLFKKRHYMVTFIQIIMPPLILLCFATIHSTVFTDNEVVSNVTRLSGMDENDLYKSICSGQCEQSQTIIAVMFEGAPNNFKETLQDVLTNTTGLNLKLLEVDSEEKMIQLAILHKISPEPRNYVGGIIIRWNDALCKLNRKAETKDCLKVKIRMAKEIPNEISASDFSNLDLDKVEQYYPLMGLQLAVSRAVMTHVDRHYKKIGISVQSFPYPPHTKLFSLLPINSNRFFISISFVLGTTFIVYSTVRFPALDKQSGFQLYLHFMGLPSWAYWLIWIINDICTQLFAVGFVVLVLFLDLNKDLGQVVKHGDPVIWTLFLILYTMASVSFFTFLASFFRRGILATYTCATIWLLSYYFADLYLPSYILNIHRASKIAMCLLPNAALIWGVTLMTSNAGGISWGNISHRLEVTGISLLEVLIVLAIDIFLYFILTLYTDMLRPGEGPERPWYFIFKLSFLNCNRRKQRKRSNRHDSVDENETELPDKTEAVIKLDNLSRNYRQHEKALDGITMRIKEDQCTVFLGHNGSGKSTLLYLLCGGVPASQGTAFVHGYSIKSQTSVIQSITSISSQKNLFCEDLTILEHLILVGKLKGMKYSQAKKDARLYLEKLDLLEKCNKLQDYLSEFEKRKLSLIMALMGKSLVVLIDEPTTGMEDDMRRSIWDFILAFQNKTILVTTSSVEEAYALGSRIAILAHGKIVGLGSPHHLEDIFVTGYHLKIKIKRGVDTSKIDEFVKTHIHTSDFVEPEFRRMTKAMSIVDTDFDVPSTMIPGGRFGLDTPTGAKLVKKESIVEIPMIQELVGNDERTDEDSDTEEVAIQLPKNEASLFSDLFILLEKPNVMSHLGILDWSVQLYSIETAFKDANMYREWANLEPKDFEIHRAQSEVNLAKLLKRYKPRQSEGIVTSLNRFRALVIKRILWMYGTRLYLLVQLLAPIILLIITIQGTNSFFQSKVEKTVIEHSLTNFPRPIVFIRHNENPDFLTRYQSVIPDSAKMEIITTNFGQRIIDPIQTKVEENLAGTFVAGVEINGTSVTAMFSPTAFHAGPISMSLVLNAHMKYSFPQMSYSIETSSHPIEYDEKELLKFYITSHESDPSYDSDEILTFAIMLGFGLFVFASGFVLQPVAERTCEIRTLQFNTTLSKFSYWLSILLCDFIVLLILIALLIETLVLMPNHNAFRDVEFRANFAAIYLLAGYGTIMQSYVASFVFHRSRTSIYAMLSYNQVLGIFAFILGQSIYGVGGFIFRLISKICLFPYNVPSAFFSLITLSREGTQCNLLSQIVKDVICNKVRFPGVTPLDPSFLNTNCCDTHCIDTGHCKTTGMYYQPHDLKRLEGLISDVLLLGIHSILMTIFLGVVELGYAPRAFKLQKEEDASSDTSDLFVTTASNKSDSLRKEHIRLQEIKQMPVEKKKNYFLVDSINVNFHARPVLTNVTLVAQPGEIVAIVGPSGSGKTVLLKVLTRLLKSTSGNAFYNEASLHGKHSKIFIKRIGYCPSEISKIYPKISGLQLLRLFGRLRGIPGSEIEHHVSKWLTVFGLQKRASGKFELYTDSMKRKFLLALALIGDPPILLLDEPIQGLDPLSKLQFWSVIKNISKSSGRIIIFTTSKTEDFVKNVGKMVILVNGSVQLVMSPTQVMTELGEGFTVSIRIKQNQAGFDDYVNLKKNVKTKLHGILLQEEQYFIKYKIPKGEFKWSDLFKIAEDITSEFTNIVDEYTIRPTELEDIYQALATKQQHFTRARTPWDEFCLQFC